MAYLIYCVFRTPEYLDLEFPPGVHDQPVILVSCNGHSAAISTATRSELAIDLPIILSYGRVIESLHRDRTVIPIRFGCAVDEKEDVIRFLTNRHNQHEVLLRELFDCVEMGVRILIPDPTESVPQSAIHDHGAPARFTPSDIMRAHPVAPGRAFLVARKVHYEREGRLTEEITTVFQDLRKALEGLFTKCKQEWPTSAVLTSPDRSLLISFYFLVPRKSLDLFCQTFQHIYSTESTKILLSGPWPPYNFVLDDCLENPAQLLSPKREKTAQ